MPVHHLVLEAAQRICGERSDPVFTPDEIVRALPHLNAQTVRTHVTSRCCINARPHHQSRLEYFRKIDRGRYELLPQHRLPMRRRQSAALVQQRTTHALSDTVHAIITKDASTYVVDCHEVAVVTQGATIDEALANLVEALAMHIEGEDLAAFGLKTLKRIHVTYELPANVSAA